MPKQNESSVPIVRRAASPGAWALSLSLLVALSVFVGCSQGTEAEPVSPAASPTSRGAASPPFSPPDDARRWGYNPFEDTGGRDPPTLYSPLPLGYRIETVLTGLDKPTQLAATPDGRLLVAEQMGTVRVVQEDRLLDDPLFSLDVFVPDVVGELGLVGIAVDPAFEQNGYVYVYYSAAGPRRTVVARVRDDGGRATDVEEILSWEAAPSCCHIGGGMRFAPDGTLFMGVGDHLKPGEAQNPLTPFGSVLRINPDGSWPDDNPFDSPVYAYGLRNPYDIAIDPETGRIFAGENGFWGQDAVVEIKRGANYGWPGFDLAVPEEQIEQPLTFYHELFGPAGVEFYSSDVLRELQGDLFVCQYHAGGALRQIEFDPDGTVGRETVRAPGCSTDVVTGADGFLYFLNYAEGTLHRIALAQG